MKKNLFALISAVLFVLNTFVLSAQDITSIEAYKIASASCHRYCPSAVLIATQTPIADGSRTLAYLFPLSPKGFIIISGNKNAVPVIAFSTESDFNPTVPTWNSVLNLIKQDLSLRFNAYAQLDVAHKQQISNAWTSASSTLAKDTLIVWPASGTTVTGGWLETNWTQNSPYNQMCPMDLNAGSRSIAGCPAVAMAQILNFLQDIKGTRFGDTDDYYHNYGAGNQYMIDDDYATRGFPSFDTLNKYLDTLENNYLSKAALSNNMKAALTFACGTACTQVYTSSGSGTFGVSQAAAAYQRFNYTHSRLVFSTDTNLSKDLAWNMKHAYPAHLALVDVGETVGHNVVVDGYNTDEFFHFNFGWGGSSNGWYTMPPTGMPYNLTVIEGVVMDIYPDSATAGLTRNTNTDNICVYPNPVNTYCEIQLNAQSEKCTITVTDLSGKCIVNEKYTKLSRVKIPTTLWAKGMYILSVKTDNGHTSSFKLIKE